MVALGPEMMVKDGEMPLNVDIVMKIRVWSDGTATATYSGQSHGHHAEERLQGAQIVKLLNGLKAEILLVLPVEGQS